MKIAFISFYSGSVYRGSESFVHDLANNLSQKHDITVFQQGEKLKDTSYKVKRYPTKINWQHPSRKGVSRRFFIDYWSLKIAIFTLKTIPTLIKERYQIIISLNGGWQVALVRIATWIYNGKMVIAGQSGIGWDDRNNLWSFPDAFVALTTKAVNWAKKANPFIKVVKIPDAVDTYRFNPKGEVYKTNLKKPIIICVGALTKYKRIDLTIKAVAKLKNVSLLLVGDGELKTELSKLGKKLLGRRFKLINSDFDKMPSIYRSADLFTLAPKSSESFGIVFIEALASNLPVVTTDDPQRRDIIGDAGIFVDPKDSHKYKMALQKALKKDWKNIPRERSLEFSWEKISKEYEELFAKLLGG